MLEPLGVPVYEQFIDELGFMIWMDNGAGYYTSKFTTKFCCDSGLLRMNWSVQSPNLNPIENLWRIIQIRINGRRHRIHNIEEMKVAIQEGWERSKGGSIKYQLL